MDSSRLNNPGKQDENTKNPHGPVKLNPVFDDLEDPETIIGHVREMSNAGDKEIATLLAKHEVNPTDTIEPPQIAWKQITDSDDVILGTLGNFSLLIGKAKSRKSFFVNIAVSAVLSKDLLMNQFRGCLTHDKRTVLYFDTEQGKYHVQLALKRICEQINEPEPTNLQVYSLRSFAPTERLSMIEYAINTTPNLGFVVIDGIKDLVTSINDEEQASMISTMLLKWTEEKEIHIVTVLHQNKGDSNARGHLGTELVNKAETTLSVTKNAQDKDISIVEAEYCRNKDPEPFAFEVIDGLPVLVENFELRTESPKNKFDLLSLPPSEIFGVLNIVFSRGESFSYSELVTQIQIAIKDKFGSGVGINRVKQLITHCKNERWIFQEKNKGPYSQGEFNDNTPYW